MSTAKKSRARMTNSDEKTTTPRRSSRSRKSDVTSVLQDVTPASQRRGRSSVSNGDVSKELEAPSSRTRRSARLRVSPTLNVQSPRQSRLSKTAGTINVTPDVCDLLPKDSTGTRRSGRRSKNTPDVRTSSSVTKSKNKRKLSTGESPLPEKVIISDIESSQSTTTSVPDSVNVINEVTSESSQDPDVDLHSAELSQSTPLVSVDSVLPNESDGPLMDCDDLNEVIPASKRRKSNEGETISPCKSSEPNKSLPITDITDSAQVTAEQDNINVQASTKSPASNPVNHDSNEKCSVESSEVCPNATSQNQVSDEVSDVVPVLNDSLPSSSQCDAVNSQSEASESQSDAVEMSQEDPNLISSQSSEQTVETETEGTRSSQESHSMHLTQEEDKTDPIDALVRDLAEKQTKDENEENGGDRNLEKKKKDKRRRSSFFRGRLSQAAVTLDVAELSSCIPFEYPADQRLEVLIQKATRHAVDRLTEEFSEIEEDNGFITEVSDSTANEIVKLKGENEFAHATNKNSFLPHPENIAMENRIAQIRSTITRLNAESEEWDRVVEKHRLAAEEAKMKNEKDHVIIAEGPSSGAVQHNVELLQRTKQQFVAMMDRLKDITKTVENYNTQTAEAIEKVVQENGAKLLGQNKTADPMKLILNLPISNLSNNHV